MVKYSGLLWKGLYVSATRAQVCSWVPEACLLYDVHHVGRTGQFLATIAEINAQDHLFFLPRAPCFAADERYQSSYSFFVSELNVWISLGGGNK